jgi:hypothetical protein
VRGGSQVADKEEATNAAKAAAMARCVTKCRPPALARVPGSFERGRSAQTLWTDGGVSHLAPLELACRMQEQMDAAVQQKAKEHAAAAARAVEVKAEAQQQLEAAKNAALEAEQQRVAQVRARAQPAFTQRALSLIPASS